MENNTQVVDIDEPIIPILPPTDVLGNPIIPKADDSTDISNGLEDIDKGSSLTTTDDPPPVEDQSVAAEDGSTTVTTDIEEQPLSSESKVYRDTLKTMFGEDFRIEMTVDGEAVEVSIDEIELDQETFTQIIQAQKEAEKQEVLKDKVSLSELDTFSRNLIEVSKRGGNVTQLLEYKEAYLDPLQGIDTDTTEGQKQVLELYYNARQMPTEEMNMVISGFETSGKLEDKALEAKEAIEKFIQGEAEKAKQSAILAEEQHKEQLKTYNKTLKAEIQTKFGLNEAKTKKLVESATKVNNETKKVPIVEAYQRMMSNPETAAELILFLNDREEFIKHITKDAVITDKLKTASKIGVVKLSGSNVEVRKRQKSDEETIVPIVMVNK